ncbi:hypothetical protein B7H23_15650 [Notoacmeibacter marinus]|uniref:Uncharacterized protein n=1 Tax=Notoacmeibacter marinus TaxID=1876515 RepID=A0A231UUF5_9HYPH|nr:hypothetical protein [Notoacmeibacter marinus]OXS99564.1 hypothetical protein B7H23_15650 [Notoacmeibacter marinus]
MTIFETIFAIVLFGILAASVIDFVVFLWKNRGPAPDPKREDFVRALIAKRRRELEAAES